MIYFVRVTVLFWHFYPQICVLYCVLCLTVAVCQPLNKLMMMMMILLAYQRIRGSATMRYINLRLTLTLHCTVWCMMMPCACECTRYLRSQHIGSSPQWWRWKVTLDWSGACCQRGWSKSVNVSAENNEMHSVARCICPIATSTSIMNELFQ